MKLTASQVKQRLAELLEISKKEADDVLWAFEQLAIETVKDAGSLTLPGIGKLECSVRPARKARNPRTGEPVDVPAKIAVKFKIATSLKDQAPSLKSKAGREALAEAEDKAAERDKRRRKREKESSSGKTASTNKKLTSKKSSSRKKSEKVSSGRKARF